MADAEKRKLPKADIERHTPNTLRRHLLKPGHAGDKEAAARLGIRPEPQPAAEPVEKERHPRGEDFRDMLAEKERRIAELEAQLQSQQPEPEPEPEPEPQPEPEAQPEEEQPASKAEAQPEPEFEVFDLPQE